MFRKRKQVIYSSPENPSPSDSNLLSQSAGLISRAIPNAYSLASEVKLNSVDSSLISPFVAKENLATMKIQNSFQTDDTILSNQLQNSAGSIRALFPAPTKASLETTSQELQSISNAFEAVPLTSVPQKKSVISTDSTCKAEALTHRYSYSDDDSEYDDENPMKKIESFGLMSSFSQTVIQKLKAQQIATTFKEMKAEKSEQLLEWANDYLNAISADEIFESSMRRVKRQCSTLAKLDPTFECK